MPIFNGWTVKFGSAGTYNTITSYVLGMSIKHEAGIGEIGTSSMTVTLNNNTGIFTPSEAGGNGTYKSTDWTANLIYAESTVTTTVGTSTPRSFTGPITDFKIFDDGKNSTVTLTAVDWIRGANTQAFTATLSATTDGFADLVQKYLRGTSGYGPGITPPVFGGTYTLTATNKTGGTGGKSLYRIATSGRTLYDVLRNTVLPSGPFGCWPTATESKGGAENFFNLNLTDQTFRTATANTEFSSTPGTSVLPISNLTFGPTLDNPTNNTTVTSGGGAFTSTATNSASVTKYGQRSRTYSLVATSTQADNDDCASLWSNRFGSVRFRPIELTTTIKQIESSCTTAAGLSLNYLLNIDTWPFTRTKITYTPTGGVSTTVYMVPVAQRITATPSDTKIYLSFLAYEDLYPFTLNDSLLGVLDTNRITD